MRSPAPLRPLLAKSDGTTLLKHTRDVENAARVLFGVLPAAPDLTRAAWLHDLGKGALFFQQAIRGETHNGMRHELFSFLWAVSLNDEKKLSDEELAAILSHHRQLWVTREHLAQNQIAEWCSESDEISVCVEEITLLIRQQLSDYKLEIEAMFGLFPAMRPRMAAKKMRELLSLCKQNPVWSPRGRALMLHRGALVASDHLASAELPPAIEGASLTRQTLESNVAKQLEERGAKFTRWKKMQRDCAKAIGNAMLVAPTGAGKTEASLLWALNNRTGGERIFYVLPYQVSINAMAKRLCELFPDENCENEADKTRVGTNQNVAIVHSNSDLAYLQESLRDDVSREEAERIARANKNAARQLYAPIKVTTVYQLLNLFFGRKFFEVGLLELSDSLVIFDEIHAYDGHTLGLVLVLLEYLQKLGVRVFIMTATLPDVLKEQLREAANISPSQEIQLPAKDPLQKEARRSIHTLDECIEAESTLIEIEKQLEAGKKVVIVCNTVQKAITLCTLLKHYEPYLVHSRFTLGDRARREKKEEIQKQKLVVATQVIEVSLDVSFDAMFTELAPADALLQRFGRVNRHGNKRTPSPVWICCGEDSGSQKVYDPDILRSTADWAHEFAKNHRKLNFAASLEWLQFTYPHGLTEAENAAMKNAQCGFESVVQNLRPMIDPIIDPDLELTLFETIQVVPAQFEKRLEEAVWNKNFLAAKELLVNVNLRSWFGASHQAQREGIQASRDREDLRKKGKYVIACFHYDEARGLDLNQPKDESNSNFY